MQNQTIILVLLLTISWSITNVKAQSTTPGNAWGATLNEYIGWDNTSGTSLRIKHALNYPINFYTNAGNTTFNNQRMTIYEDPANAGVYNAGYVGIGIITPLYHLDVKDHININNPVYPTTGSVNDIGCYMIGSLTVLHNNGNNNIFTGVGAGLGISTGTSNTFNGFSAGNINNTGSNNTNIGFNAGKNNTSGNSNTIVGSEAGFTNSTSDSSVCIGVRAGYTNDQSANVYIGARAGVNSGTGTSYNNVFVGYQAGAANTSNGGNVYVGANAALNNIGAENVMVSPAVYDLQGNLLAPDVNYKGVSYFPAYCRLQRATAYNRFIDSRFK